MARTCVRALPRHPPPPISSPASRRGDREAFSRFYDTYASLAFGLIRRVLRDPESAEEVLQEVFWQVWQDAPRYDPARGTPEAWLIMRAKTRAIDKLRSIRRRDQTFVTPVDEAVARPTTRGDDPGAGRRGPRSVAGALEQLPEPQRRVHRAGVLRGLTQAEIAARLGEPLGTVKTRMRLGLERLRGALRGDDRSAGEDEHGRRSRSWRPPTPSARSRATIARASRRCSRAGDPEAAGACAGMRGEPGTGRRRASGGSARVEALRADRAARARHRRERRRPARSARVDPCGPWCRRRRSRPASPPSRWGAGIDALRAAAGDPRPQEAASSMREVERQQSVLAVLRDPATQVVALAGQARARGARARMLWHEKAGGLLVAAGCRPRRRKDLSALGHRGDEARRSRPGSSRSTPRGRPACGCRRCPGVARATRSR